MNLKEIKELIEMIRGTEVSEIELEREGSRIRIRLGEGHIHHSVETFPVAHRTASKEQAEPTEIPAGIASDTGVPEMVPGQVVITSPMVGTFYRSPTPDSSPFIEVGSTIEKGQTLCIIEAMKLMNEIEAERKGRILKIIKEDKDPVEYGEPLFIMEPVT
jgi:acetyl-CoA carboxylase biotin carboxyl carrier protein